MADVNCMKDLLMAAPDLKLPNDAKSKENVDKFWAHPHMKGKKFRTDWKYMLNLASTEFPLRTNLELVQILTLYNGTNDIEAYTYPEYEVNRFKFKYVLGEDGNSLKNTEKPKDPPPYNYTIVKGNTYCSFSRAFVEYAMNSVEARAYLEWLNDTIHFRRNILGHLAVQHSVQPSRIFQW